MPPHYQIEFIALTWQQQPLSWHGTWYHFTTVQVGPSHFTLCTDVFKNNCDKKNIRGSVYFTEDIFIWWWWWWWWWWNDVDVHLDMMSSWVAGYFTKCAHVMALEAVHKLKTETSFTCYLVWYLKWFSMIFNVMALEAVHKLKTFRYEYICGNEYDDRYDGPRSSG